MTPANYTNPAHGDSFLYHQNEEMTWKHLSSAVRMAAWTKLMEQAKAAASTPEEKQRVAIFEKSIWSDMVEGRKNWEKKEK